MMEESELYKILTNHWTQEDAFEWLFMPHPQLKNHSPMAMLIGGNKQPVFDMLKRLDECGYL